MRIIPESGIGPTNGLIDEHPCYSEGASHRYARLHLAVAPACNIQCRYCNRRFDCVNESRPGVVSALLTPEQALERVREARQRLPMLRVIGIAGPGDPLANRERVFSTCRLVRDRFPDLHLCLSTNGLNLVPDTVDEIVSCGIRHVTLTLNALDPRVGAKIYAWVRWKNFKIEGVEGAGMLLERQLIGLHALIARGVLVKVNTVLIPGINADQIGPINRLVSEAGAFSHNVVPMISAPEHGTEFGLAGMRGPTSDELQRAREACRGSARVMTHCRQCRADAAGLLGEDRHAELTVPEPRRGRGRLIAAIAGGAEVTVPVMA
ncbi:FeMo cofactor biosynthesis protein NifB [Candidatus Magnetaquicoccaceae bacterium FCR-1]|uniref:FeMo cofactor biosynthesis protein NifB n=1 Tax=Candidatus Magnetaquiglobus chichijimensis TaxID=3141448 RepID=A0ABQ0C5U0_9PROT